MISYEDITNKNKINFKDVELKKAAIYSGEDVYITNKLYEKHIEEKTTEDRVLNEIELPLIHVLKKMEIDGVKIDADRLK
ncbi:MAG: hypothetical protein Q8S84_03270 [bacterium]|nr:hypothetical protein [bacterium]MDP3380546.1 hypothetical protein [bacterium]